MRKHLVLCLFAAIAACSVGQNAGPFRSFTYLETGYRDDNYNNGWIFSDSGQHNYNIYGYDTNFIYFTYGAPDWLNSINKTYTYNAAGQVLNEIDQTWNGVHWLNATNYVNLYSSANKILFELVQTWNSGPDNWVNATKTAYQYDSSNYLINWLIVDWDTTSSSWFNQNQYFDSNDASGNVLVETTQTWNGSAWINVYKYINSYGGGEPRGKIWQYWNAGTSTWVNKTDVSNYYNAGNNDTLTLTDVWDSATHNWLPDSKTINTFNNNNEIQTENFGWNSNSASYIPSNEYVYTYDANNNRILDLVLDYNSATSSFDSSYRTIYYYQGFNVSGIVSIPDELKANLYPNPSSGVCFIVFAEPENMAIALSLYDATGRLLNYKTQNIIAGANQIELNYPALAPGNYFIRLNDQSGRQSVLRWEKE